MRHYQTLFWCPGEDSNLHGLHHWYLKPARLPIPPPGPGRLFEAAGPDCQRPLGDIGDGPPLSAVQPEISPLITGPKSCQRVPSNFSICICFSG